MSKSRKYTAGDKINRDESGTYEISKSAGFNPAYKSAIESYLTIWSELFERAKEKDEAQFVLALLRFKGAEDSGWDTFENTIEAFDGMMKYQSKLDGTTRLNMALWLYGHIVEASDHYEIIANMVNISVGQPYRAWNFPKIEIKRKKRTIYREPTPNEKILEIQKRCTDNDLSDYAAPFIEVLDTELRNSIFHSDYSVHEGKVRYRNEQGFRQELNAEDTLNILNSAIALHEVIKNLVKSHRRYYTESVQIPSGPHFTPENAPDDVISDFTWQVIVRKNKGVIALHELPFNSSAMAIGNYLPNEQKYIDEGHFLLPASVNEDINKLANKLPLMLARLFIKSVKPFVPAITWFRYRQFKK